MKKIKVLGSSLFVSILLAFILPMPIVGIVNHDAKSLSVQTSVQNQQLVGDDSFRVSSGGVGFNVTVHTDALKVYTPTTMPTNWNSEWLDPNHECFTYSNIDYATSEWVSLDHVNKTTGQVYLKFYGTSQQTGTFGAVARNYPLSLDTPSPSFVVNSSGTRTLPSDVTTSSFTNYVTENDPNKTFIKATSVAGDNSKGTLKVNGTYYKTTFHGNKAAIGNFSTTISGFSKNTNPPVISFNKVNISHITEADFESKIIANNPKTTMDNMKGFMAISNLDVSMIKTISYVNGKVTVTYYTSLSGSGPTKTIDSFVSGFATKVAAPIITINQTNISKITENDFKKKIVANDPSKTLKNLKDYVTVSGIAIGAIKNISYTSSGKKNFIVSYHANTWSGSATNDATHEISGFVTSMPAPTISVNNAGKKVLPSILNVNNYTQYLSVGTNGTISSIVSFSPNDATGHLDFRIKFYTTSFHGSGAPTDFYTYLLDGFITSTNAPSVSFKTVDQQVLPSIVNDHNYQTYFNISDPKSSIVTGSIKYEADNAVGKLTVTGSYYATSIHTSGSTTGNFSYSSSDFAHSSVVPILTINSEAKKVVPSTIDISNYSNYLDIKDPDKSLITSSLRFNSDDANGKLTIRGSYYVSSYHGGGAPTTKYEPNAISGFSFNKKTNGI